MKKSLILPITLAALLMAGCDTSSVPAPVSSSEAPQSSSVVDSSSEAPTSSSAEATHTVSITNKADLQAEFAVGDANRTISITGTPEIEDINDALDDGLVTVTSSNPDVLAATRIQLRAVAEGTATVTVTYGDATDTVEITVIPARGPQSLYGTTHAGTAEDPFDNADAVLVGTAMGSDKSAEYYIKGTVDRWYHFPGENASYTSWYFEPVGEEAQFEAYKISNSEGTGLTADEVFPGAVVTVKGKITSYQGQCETDTGKFVELVSGTKPAMNTVSDKTCADIVTEAKARQDCDTTWDEYVVEGYVQSISGNNYFIGDAKLGEDEKPVIADLVEIFGYDAETLGVAEGSVDTQILVGSKVQVKGHVKCYHGQTEIICLNGLVKVTEAGVVVVATPATVTEALAAGQALTAAVPEGQKAYTAVGTETYAVTGYVVKKNAWNSSYGNADLYIADAADEKDTSKMLDVFRYKKEAIFNEIQIGDQITVTCTLQHYVQYEDATLAKVKKDVIETNEGPSIKIEVCSRTIEDVLLIASSLTNNEVTEYKYSVKGYIISKGEWSSQYGNVDFKIATRSDETDETKMITVYRYTDQTTFETLEVGDYVSVTSAITVYIKTDKTTGAVLSTSVQTEAKKAVVVKLEKPVTKNYVDGVAGQTYKFEFGKNTDFKNWTNSYATHTVTEENFEGELPSVQFDFSAASKQTQTVTDCPVSKKCDLTVAILGKVGVKGFKVTFSQWGSRTQKASAAAGATVLVAEADVDFTAGLSYSGTEAISTFKISTTNTSNQIGWYSIELTF